MPALRGEALRKLAWPYIYEWVALGYKANQIYRMAEEAGISYRRKDLLRDVRMIKSGIDLWSVWKFPKPGEVVDLEAGAVREVDIDAPYLINAEVEIWDERGRFLGYRKWAMETGVRSAPWEYYANEIEAEVEADCYNYSGTRVVAKVVALYEPWKRKEG